MIKPERFLPCFFLTVLESSPLPPVSPIEVPLSQHPSGFLLESLPKKSLPPLPVLVFCSKPSPAPMYTIPPVRHPHPPSWASHAPGHLSMQLAHGRKGSPSSWKWMQKNLPGGPRQMEKTIGLLRVYIFIF